MEQNPYKYKGPINPQKDSLVCITRDEAVKKVIVGINRNDYWTILGPRQIGKTTFLHLIKKEFPSAHYIHFNFEVPPSNKKKLFQELIKKISPDQPEQAATIDDDDPALSFLNFLEKFRPEEDKKIIFLFDEIDSLPSLNTFLHTWRRVYHERQYNDELKKYIVIITGATDLIKLTIGPNSPFNITETLTLEDFSDEESEMLIVDPLKELIEPKAKEKLLSQMSGHPQMLQHACHILVEKVKASKETITEDDVDKAIERLFKENTSLKTLKQDIKRNSELRKLIGDILRGEKRKFLPNSEFSLLGAGAIKEVGSFCEIRNEVYKRFLTDIFLEVTAFRTSPKKKENSTKTLVVLLVLAIITGFVSILTKSSEGMLAALVLTVLTFIIPPIVNFFARKRKKAEAKENEQKEQQ